MFRIRWPCFQLKLLVKCDIADIADTSQTPLFHQPTPYSSAILPLQCGPGLNSYLQQCHEVNLQATLQCIVSCFTRQPACLPMCNVRQAICRWLLLRCGPELQNVTDMAFISV